MAGALGRSKLVAPDLVPFTTDTLVPTHLDVSVNHALSRQQNRGQGTQSAAAEEERQGCETQHVGLREEAGTPSQPLSPEGDGERQQPYLQAHGMLLHTQAVYTSTAAGSGSTRGLCPQQGRELPLGPTQWSEALTLTVTMPHRKGTPAKQLTLPMTHRKRHLPNNQLAKNVLRDSQNAGCGHTWLRGK